MASSSSESRSSNTNTSVTTTKDNRVAADNGAIVNRNGNVTVNTTDGGAILMAGEIADQAIDAGVLFAEMGSSIAAQGLEQGGELARYGFEGGESLAELGIETGSRLADEGFDIARHSMGSTIQTLEAIIDRDRDDAAQLSEQLVNMIPWLVAGVVAWSIFK